MKRKHLFIALAIILSGFILGTFLDKNISDAIVVGEVPILSLLVTGFGEYASSGTIAFLGMIAIFYPLKHFNKTNWKVLFALAGVVLILYVSYEQGKSMMDLDAFGKLFPELFSKKIMLPVVGFVVLSPMIILGYLGQDKINTQQLFNICIVVGGAIVLGLLLNKVTKEIIARPRYRIAELYGIQNSFTPWYKPLSEESKNILLASVDASELESFPSGHASSSAYFMLALPFFANLLDSLKNKKTMLFYIGFGISLLVSMTRVLQGAHYLSDVMYGMLISVVMIFIANEIINKYFSKTEVKA